MDVRGRNALLTFQVSDAVTRVWAIEWEMTCVT